MEFPQIVRALAEELRLTDLIVDEDGACAVRFDDVTVSFHPDEDGAAFTASAILGTVACDDATILGKLLAANLYGDGSGESTFGVDDSGKAWLVRRFSCANLTFATFLQELEGFVNHSESWQQRLQGEEHRSTDPNVHASVASTNDYMRA